MAAQPQPVSARDRYSTHRRLTLQHTQHSNSTAGGPSFFPPPHLSHFVSSRPQSAPSIRTNVTAHTGTHTRTQAYTHTSTRQEQQQQQLQHTSERPLPHRSAPASLLSLTSASASVSANDEHHTRSSHSPPQPTSTHTQCVRPAVPRDETPVATTKRLQRPTGGQQPHPRRRRRVAVHVCDRAHHGHDGCCCCFNSTRRSLS